MLHEIIHCGINTQPNIKKISKGTVALCVGNHQRCMLPAVVRESGSKDCKWNLLAIKPAGWAFKGRLDLITQSTYRLLFAFIHAIEQVVHMASFNLYMCHMKTMSLIVMETRNYFY